MMVEQKSKQTAVDDRQEPISSLINNPAYSLPQEPHMHMMSCQYPFYKNTLLCFYFLIYLFFVWKEQTYFDGVLIFRVMNLYFVVFLSPSNFLFSPLANTL